jgi:hypothetical protein
MSHIDIPVNREAHADKPILSIEDVKQLLDCSRTNIYNLIDEEIIIPHYFPGKKKRPYFLLDQILGALKAEKKEG